MVPELSVENAAEWLARHNLPTAGVHFAELGGGISNKVILAESPGFRAVLKQSLGQLRTQSTWLSDRSRILREAQAMRWLQGKCPNVPRILFGEPDTFTIAMEAAPANAAMWKTQLFGGKLDRTLAHTAGTALASIISASWHNPEAERIFGDQTVFDELRLDPYYRFAAASRPEAADYIQALLNRTSQRRVSLVHGDWSPKNLLVAETNLWVIDWEVVHYGDPSFDVGFLLNHLLLKSLAMPQHHAALASLAESFLEGLASGLPNDAIWVIAAGFEHLPALMLARVDGKSPAEYLNSEMRSQARDTALALMKYPVQSTKELFSR